MAAQVIVLLPVREGRGEPAALRRAQTAVMEKRLLSERPRLPSDHPGGGDGDPVDPSRHVWDVTSNGLKALAPEKLALSGDVGLTFEAVGIRAVSIRLSKDRAGNSEGGILREPAQEELE